MQRFQTGGPCGSETLFRYFFFFFEKFYWRANTKEKVLEYRARTPGNFSGRSVTSERSGIDVCFSVRSVSSSLKLSRTIYGFENILFFYNRIIARLVVTPAGLTPETIAVRDFDVRYGPLVNNFAVAKLGARRNT